MFGGASSFFGRTKTPPAEQSQTPPPDSSYTAPGGSGANGSGALFGGMDVKAAADTEADAASSSTATATDAAPVSSFSFLQDSSSASAATGPDVPLEQQSSFSFLNAGGSDSQQGDAVPPATASGFDFLSGGGDSTESASASQPGSSSFSFLNSTAEKGEEAAAVGTARAGDAAPAELDLLSMQTPTEQPAPQEVKLSRAASTSKVVRKKKRVSKVGFGREEDGDADSPASPTPAGSASGASGAGGGAVGGRGSSAISALPAIEEDQDNDADPALAQSQQQQQQQQQSGFSFLSASNPGADSGAAAEDDGADSGDASLAMQAAARALATASGGTVADASLAMAAANTSTSSSVARHGDAEGDEDELTIPHATVDLSSIPARPSYSPTPPSPAGDGGGLLDGMNISPAPPPSRTAPVAPVIPALPQPPSTAPPAVAPLGVQPPHVEVDLSACTTAQRLQRLSLKVLQDLAGALRELSRQHTSALASQQHFRAEIDAETAAVAAARARLASLEAEQARLAELEEFDKADALSAEIEAAQGEIPRRRAAVTALLESVKLLEATFVEERGQTIAAFFSAMRRLAEARDEIKQEVSSSQAEEVERDEIEEARLKAELERIDMEKSHFAREEEALSKEQQTTQEAIQAKTDAFRAKKEESEAKMFAVQLEIRQLEEALKAKRAEEAGLQQDLQQVESSIAGVHKKYERQLQRISDRQAALRQTKTECQQEEEQLLRDRDEYYDALTRAEREREGLELWTKSLGADISIAETLLSSTAAAAVAKDKGVGSTSQQQHLDMHPDKHARVYSNFLSSSSLMASISSLESSSAEEYDSLSQELEAAESALRAGQQESNTLAAQQEAVTAELRALAEQMPKLEGEKKAHAANKRFKEAAAVAKDLKDLMARKDALEEEAEQAAMMVRANCDKVAALEAAQEAAAEALRDAHKRKDIERFEALLARAADVRSMRRIVRKHVKLRTRMSTLMMMTPAEKKALAAAKNARKSPVPTSTDADANLDASSSAADADSGSGSDSRDTSRMKNVGGSGLTNGGPESDLCGATLSFLDAELCAVLEEARSIQQKHGLEDSTDLLHEGMDTFGGEAGGVDEVESSDEESDEETEAEAEDGSNEDDDEAEGDKGAACGTEVGEVSEDGDDNCEQGEGEDDGGVGGEGDRSIDNSNPTGEDGGNEVDAEGEAEGQSEVENEVEEEQGGPGSAIVNEGEDEDDGAAAQKRHELMLEAKELACKLNDLNEKLQQASDNEEYEEAAELFEQISNGGEELEKKLVVLKCAREDVELYERAL